MNAFNLTKIIGTVDITGLSAYLLKAGDTMTGALTFSGTTNSGIAVNNLTTTQKNALTPATGMIVYDTTLGQFHGYSGSWAQIGGSSAISGLTIATAINTIDNTNYAQAWNWSTATTQTPLTITGNAITTGSLLSLTSSYAAGNSTNGLLYVANTSAVTNGIIARIASNSTAGSGLTVLASGNVGIGTTAPASKLEVYGPGSGLNTGLKISNIGSYDGNKVIDLSGSGITGTAQYYIYNGTNSYWRSDNMLSLNGGILMAGTIDNYEGITISGAGGLIVNEALTVKGTGNSSIAGNVGIGTTSPIEKFQVTGGHIYASGTGTTSGFVTNNWGIWQTASNLFGIGYQPASDAGAQLSITTAGNVGIGTTSPTNLLSLGGNATRIFWMERGTVANTAGYSLTVQSGGATSGATDKNGGQLILQPGLSTGTGIGSIALKRLTRAGSTGTSDNTLVDAHIIAAEKTITAEGSVDLFEVALPAGGICGGLIQFQITATDGTELQVHSGAVTYAAVNKGGVYTSQITDMGAAADSNAGSAGATTDTWAITSGTNKITISTTIACSSITANLIKIYYSVFNGGVNAITQL